MAKTKRTVEEVNVAASNDSKLITQSKLSRFATNFWARIKSKYDNVLNEVRLSDRTSQDKKLIFTRVNGTPKEIDLIDYVRIQDKNDFKQDVSSNVGMTDGTLKLGTIGRTENRRRVSGHRSITTKQFVDKYVSHLTILTDESLTAGTNSSWTVWAVEKKENRDNDIVRKIYNSNAVVKETNINGVNYNSVEVPINDKFDNEVYFIVGCDDQSKGYRVIKLKTEYQNNDVINIITRHNVGDTIRWEPAYDNIAVMIIHGRESIGSLSEKINKLNPDSGLYVKNSETTKTGGTSEKADKVVRLGDNGKLDKDMLPSIAINEYFGIEQFNHEKLDAIKERFENGDVVVVTGENTNKGKRFLCVNKQENTNNLTEGFVELNSKDGIVKSVNGKIGEVVLDLVSTENSLKLTIGNGAGDAVEKIVNIVTDDEIDAIIDGLQD